jgi:hypothetical protein
MFSIAIGATGAGANNQKSGAIAIGTQAGQNTQGTDAIAIGTLAAVYSQRTGAIAIGLAAGFSNQGTQAIAIGFQAGVGTQNQYAVAIGYQAGQASQGTNSVAIGFGAGQTQQPANTIVINAQTTTLSPGAGTNRLYVAPIRGPTGSGTTNVLQWDATSKEITYVAKTFVIDHPKDPSKYLVHGCLEAQRQVFTTVVRRRFQKTMNRHRFSSRLCGCDWIRVHGTDYTDL